MSKLRKIEVGSPGRLFDGKDSMILVEAINLIIDRINELEARYKAHTHTYRHVEENASYGPAETLPPQPPAHPDQQGRESE